MTRPFATLDVGGIFDVPSALAMYLRAMHCVEPADDDTTPLSRDDRDENDRPDQVKLATDLEQASKEAGEIAQAVRDDLSKRYIPPK